MYNPNAQQIKDATKEFYLGETDIKAFVAAYCAYARHRHGGDGLSRSQSVAEQSAFDEYVTRPAINDITQAAAAEITCIAVASYWKKQPAK